MWGLLATLLFSPFGCLVDAACPRTNVYFNDTPCLNLTGFPSAKVNFSMWNQVKELDLSNNKIVELSELKSEKQLQSLFLHNNKLKSLPSDFFSKTPNLKVLRLEKNQLDSLSIKKVYHCLEKLHVDCHCNVAVGILDYCHNCSDRDIKCQCLTSESLDNVTDYYQKECSGYDVQTTRYVLYIAIIIPILVLLSLAILVFFVIRRKKGAPINQEKRPSNTSEGTSGQSRYVSRLPSPGNTFQDPEFHKDYENVLNDESKGKMRSGQGNHQSQKQTTTKRSPSTGENKDSSEGHQPIYANTQDLYYNYSYNGKPIPETVDDVYVIPDQ